jgi:hypothetical protein
MQCEEAVRVMGAAVGRAEIPAALAAHLRACAACRETWDVQHDVQAALATWPEGPRQDGFAARLAARLDREDAGLGILLPAVNWRRWSLGLMPAAAALLWLAFAGPLPERTDVAGETAAALMSWGLQEGAPDPGDTDPVLQLLPLQTGDRR